MKEPGSRKSIETTANHQDRNKTPKVPLVKVKGGDRFGQTSVSHTAEATRKATQAGQSKGARELNCDTR